MAEKGLSRKPLKTIRDEDSDADNVKVGGIGGCLPPLTVLRAPSKVTDVSEYQGGKRFKMDVSTVAKL